MRRLPDGTASRCASRLTEVQFGLHQSGPQRHRLVSKWAGRSAGFERRAGFATMAHLAARGARAQHAIDDAVLIGFLPLIEAAATDERTYVKKAVNWALRGIGKSSPALAAHAERTARRLQAADDRTARWVGRHRMGEVFGG